MRINYTHSCVACENRGRPDGCHACGRGGKCNVCGGRPYALWNSDQAIFVCRQCAETVLPALIADALGITRRVSMKSACERARHG